jgi:Na+-driven multidrug efflux pump
VWFANTLSSVLRGSGNMLLPALALIGGAVLHVPLAASLVLGLGPMPQLGIAGAAIAYVSTFTLAGLAMAAVVFRPGSALRPRQGDWRLERARFREILRVGIISTANSVQTVLTAVILTGFVGRFGPAALAGYGVGLRLELLQIPLVFAVGQAMVVLVGTHIGAGRAERAKRIAWTGAAFAASIGLAIGAWATFFPLGWVGLFSADPAVLAAGTSYLRSVAPFYALLAAGIALYFASQGAARVAGPMLAGTARLAIVLAGGMAAATLSGIFVTIAVGMIAYGALSMWVVRRTAWK